MGKPVWVGSFGEMNSATNFIILKDMEARRSNESIEVWMTLDESIMNFLEHDPKFLAFASLNPSITIGNGAPSSKTSVNSHSCM
ncbi:hypothetical protein M5689_004679 [Euphorbia peplus]|nr:hypothetical protein M5689_004679 [Euphorbia peplus]